MADAVKDDGRADWPSSQLISVPSVRCGDNPRAGVQAEPQDRIGAALQAMTTHCSSSLYLHSWRRLSGRFRLTGRVSTMAVEEPLWSELLTKQNSMLEWHDLTTCGSY
jgi:hypothetical protein